MNDEIKINMNYTMNLLLWEKNDINDNEVMMPSPSNVIFDSSDVH